MTRLRLSSALTSLDLDETKSLVQKDIADFFSKKESDYLADRHIRTTIGWLALKRAIIELVEEEKNISLREKDICLQCRSDGRPFIAEIGVLPELMEALFISISHTRSTAYGLAALQEGCNGHES